jgi:D-glycero-D-manno-heptose 1,7-bisphosphate phosphatase
VSTERPAVFLDRDGVINKSVVERGIPHPPATLDEFELLEGVDEAVERIRQAGYAVVVATNQPDVSRGDQEQAVVEAMHGVVRDALAPDAIMVCYHDDAEGCECRKPAPGMLLQAARDLNLNLTRSFMVGDRWRDIEAGRRAGCRTVYVDHGYTERQPDEPDAVVTGLPEAVTWILETTAHKEAEIA